MGWRKVFEVFIYLVAYGVFPMLARLLSFFMVVIPLAVLLGPAAFVAVYLMYLVYFVIYFRLNNWLIGVFGGQRKILFTIVFSISLAIHTIFVFTTCSLSMLIPCDTSEYFSLWGMFRLLDFYLVVLGVFVASGIYSKYKK